MKDLKETSGEWLGPPGSEVWVAPAWTFLIEKNIPLPPRAFNKGSKPITYHWKDLQIGDSFIAHPSHSAEKIRVNCQGAYTTHGFRMAVRQLPDGRIRVWRVG